MHPEDGDRVRREVTTAVDNRTYVPRAKILVREYLETWLAGLRLKPQTIAGYEGDAPLHITPHIGHIPLSDLSRAHLNRLHRLLETEGSPGGRGRCPRQGPQRPRILCSALIAADVVLCRGTAWLKDADHAGTPLRPDRVSESFRAAS